MHVWPRMSEFCQLDLRVCLLTLIRIRSGDSSAGDDIVEVKDWKGRHTMSNSALEGYRDYIKEKVCVHCIDADQFGNCRIGGGKICPFDLYFDKVVTAVSRVKSDRYEDYAQSLRVNVCRTCTYGNAAKCADRAEVECALDRYFPLVVDAIEEVGFDAFMSAYRENR